MPLTFADSHCELRRAHRVQFGVLSPDEVKSMSVVEVTKPESVVKGIPVMNGLLDRRMGTAEKHFKCATCAGSMQDCPGHFGHIELSEPVYHIGFVGVITKILRCVCHYCHRLLVDESSPAFRMAMTVKNRKTRFELIHKMCSGKHMCVGGDTLASNGAPGDGSEPRGCGRPQPRVRLLESFKIVAQVPTGSKDTTTKVVMDPRQVLTILKNVSDEDYRKLGFNPDLARPDWFVLTVLPVPPPPVRPCVMLDSTMRGEDDLSHKLADVILSNTRLKEAKQNGAPAHTISELLQLLQYHCATMVNNQLSGQPMAKQTSGKPIKSIRQRLVGKHGRVRGNLMGKRVDFSARTVITGDPNLSIAEVGVPRSIALTLTYPETVTPFNIERLRRLVENGPGRHPGARYIIRHDGTRIDLRYQQKVADQHLDFGFQVERHINDGDLVLFNRQPSLHKMSIMGHRVRVMPCSTFRINLAVTTPYNADFDGDEMNLHVPQSEETRAEVQELMLVPHNIVSPQANRNVIGLVQDTLVASTLLTERDTFITRDVMMNMMLWVPGFEGALPQPAILKPEPLWTGKQLFSMFIPHVNLMRVSAHHPDKELDKFPPAIKREKEAFSLTDSIVLIMNGDLIHGTLCKKTLGNSAGSLVHVIWKELGADAARAFLDAAQFIMSQWMLTRGFSIGIGDTIADERTMGTISQTLTKAFVQVDELIEMRNSNKMLPMPGRTPNETFEHKVNEVLKKAIDEAGRSASSSLRRTNNFKIMSNSGSKGSFINIAQITACVGQQNVEGKRIGFGFRGRSLPHFSQSDDRPASRGFVSNSYLRGLTPEEFFFHAMGGREGLIDTAVKTAETGYIQRRLVKAMEDVQVKYDGSVRNGIGDVLQFLYGEDGMDGAHIESQRLDIINMNDVAFDRAFRIDVDAKFDPSDPSSHPESYITADNLEMLRTDTDDAETLRNELAELREIRDELRKAFPSGEPELRLPVNMRRVIENAQRTFVMGRNEKSDLSPALIIDTVRATLEEVVVVIGTSPLAREAQANATLLFRALILSTLSAKRVLKDHRLNADAFRFVLGEIKTRFQKARAVPGDMVGPIAAQSIGEPATQMTLNTFHLAGVGSKNVTQGVPRLKELMNVAANVKTPSIKVALARPTLDRAEAQRVAAQLEFTLLRHVTEATEIWYDPDPLSTVIPEDQEMVRLFWDLETTTEDRDSLTRWLLRIVLNREMITAKHLLLQEIADKIDQKFEHRLQVIYSDQNADPLVIRLRMRVPPEEASKDEPQDDAMMRSLESMLMSSLSLKGIPQIRKALMEEVSKSHFDPDTLNLETTKTYVLETEGANLREVFANSDVDFAHTTSNDVTEVLSVLGIEAARRALFTEIRTVIEFDGSYVNYRHLGMLADVMTYRGQLMSITRHGINRVDSGPLMRCSFEETVEILMDAAMFAETDHLNGVTENVMLGQLCPLGTGFFDVLLDEKKVELAVETQRPIIQDIAGDMMFGSSAHHGSVATPYANTPGIMSPILGDGAISPTSAAFSPAGASPYGASPFSPLGAADSGTSPAYAGASASPAYQSASPAYGAPSPAYGAASPAYQAASPAYGAASPAYSPASPAYGAASPAYSPASPAYSPASPAYSPASPAYSPTSPASPAYSPASPAYSPASPAYSPASPAYSPASPAYSPASPAYSPSSPAYSPSSPAYSPKGTNPGTRPAYGHASPAYSPASPAYSPSSPAYSPSSPSYSPSHGSSSYSPSASPGYGTSAAAYSPSVSGQPPPPPPQSQPPPPPPASQSQQPATQPRQ